MLFDNLNQYTKVSSTNYTYDKNRTLTSDGTWTYTYDYENRLTSASKTGTTAIYKYDRFDRRIQKNVDGVTTNYIYDGDQVICETDSAGIIITKYIFGPGIDEPITMQRGADTYYYHFDGLGSVTALTNSSGETVETYTYDVYGKPSTISTLGNPYMFTGREYDPETGLYYYRARMYSPTLGRFLQTDPIGYFAGLNLYTYCDNNPLNWVDPFGLDKKKDKPWWEKLEEGYYYGTGLGEEAAEWYAKRYVETDNPLWAVPGSFAALWTPETYQRTGWTLISGYLTGRVFDPVRGAPKWVHYEHARGPHKYPHLQLGDKHIQIPKWLIDLIRKSAEKFIRAYFLK